MQVTYSHRLVPWVIAAFAAASGSGAVRAADDGAVAKAPAASQATGSPAVAVAQPSAKPGLQFIVGEGGVVRLPAATTTLTVTGVPNLDQMGAAEISALAQSLTITDRGMARGAAMGATVAFPKPPEFIGRSGANGLTWRVTLEAGIPPGASQVRMAGLSFGVAKPEPYAIEYTLSGKTVGTASWTPRGASDVWTVSWSDKPDERVFAVTIENPDEPLSNVRLVQSTLKDATGRMLGVDRMHLFGAPDAKDAATRMDVPGNGTRTLFLRLDDASVANLYGTFDGVIRFAADGSAATKDVPLKIRASSDGRRLLGLGAVAAGLLLTISITGFARPRMARLQARRAAAAVRQALAHFDAELAEAGASLPQMAFVSKELAASIADKALDRAGLLPRGFALAPAFEMPTDGAAALTAKLDDVSKRLEGLLILLRTGLPPVKRRLDAKATKDGAEKLLEELDECARQVTDPQSARAKADDIAARAKALQATEHGSQKPSPVREVNVDDLDFQIRGLSDLMWVVWALVALVIAGGWIAADAAFGTTLDLVASFAWGFGMTTFGAGIQNLTPGTVASQLKVKLPS